jgi:hypothetical protein
MRVLVCGSRDWGDGLAIYRRLCDLPGGSVVVHGGARGADATAGKAADILGYDVEVFPADWDRYGKRAGFLRNVAMLETGPGLVLAFQSNNSRGTQHTINEARKRGIPVEVHAQ